MKELPSAWTSPRCWAALVVLVAAWFAIPQLETAIYHPLAHAMGLHMIQQGAMMLTPYAWLMVVRLVVNFSLVVVFGLLRGSGAVGFPLSDRRVARHLGFGIAIGLFVMVAAILIIVLCGAARISPSTQPVLAAAEHGFGWLIFDLMGATGEELYGRGAVILVAAAFFGWRGALLASGASFVLIHLGNPGASWIWLLRLFLQGVLLAYAVYRTGSLWWSVGYHAGWNWASAPLFGAAGSGYLDEGHIFDFKSTGPTFLTGGAVGPEGSIFAFLAVLVAYGLMVGATRREHE